jgi:hypothetical protein
MNISTITAKVLSNKHTTGAAVLYAAAKWGCPTLAIWWPSHKAQIDTSANILEGAAVFYMGLSAGDAQKSATKEDLEQTKKEIDTAFVKKSDIPQS